MPSAPPTSPSSSSAFDSSNKTTSSSTPSSSSSSTPSSAASAGINYIGMYDSQLKRFLALEQGLDGPVQDLVCDDASNQVFVVGGFRAPVPDMSTATNTGDEDGSVTTKEYQTLGVFGGGVAVWKPAAGGTSCAGGHCHKAQGSWSSLPFKGVNGMVNSVTKAQDGTFWFGGRFDTTTDGEQFSAPDTQPVNMDSVKVFTGNGIDTSQDRDIICQPSTNTRGNWIMRDNIPGYWRAQFPLYITPTLFRLWNVDMTQGPGAVNRGTKTFSVMAQPTNQLLNLSYVDQSTNSIQYCTVCPLQQRTTDITGASSDFQDFVVVTPVLLHAAQVDVVSWYGLGGGLGGIEVYQSEIFARAVSELNLSSQCSTPPGAKVSAATAGGGGGGGHGDYDMTAYSTSMGADWKTMKIPDGWQTVLAASVSATDEGVRKPAYVDLAPYLQESGMYDVYLYTPACGGTFEASSNSTGPLPSNACANRGSVDVNMYFGSPGNVVTMTVSQMNTKDKADKIYSGMVVHSTGDFRPHVVVGPSISTSGTSGGGSTLQTVIVDSIQFVKQATLNNTNSMLFYRPGTGQVSSDPTAPTKDKAQGLDASTWGNLPTQLPSGAVVNSLAASHTGSASLLFISGEFQGTGFSNIVAWNGSKFVPLGGSSVSSGVDGAVSSIVLEGQSTLYVVGSFNQALGAAPIPLPGGFASYSIETRTWTSLGNVSQVFLPGTRFQSVEISVGDAGQPQLVVTGKFSWANGAKLSTAPSSSGMASVAIWDIRSGTWIQETEPALASQGQRFEFGYVRGQISYLNRIMGSVSSSGSGNATTTQPVVLVAGMIDSLDTYQTNQPENMAWLSAAGGLRTMNLVPSVPIPSSTGDMPPTDPIANSPVLPTTNAGIMYFNRTSQAWITIVGGSRANGSIGAGYFYSPPVPSSEQDSTLSFKELNLQGSVAVGEIFALGLSKSEIDGYSSAEAGSDLLLLGGAFKSPSTSGANTNGLVVYDLSSDQLVTGFPGLRVVSGRGEPVVNMIKSKPGQRILVVAGDFAGVGKDTICEGVCLWDPVLARQALNKRKSLDSSFKSLYGDNGGKKNMGVLKGVVNDIAFEDDKNMYVAGDLVVNGVACGVASFNFDHAKWTTFGSMITPAQLSGPAGASHPPGSDTLTGPVTAIAHDSMFHQFFIAGRSSTDGSAYFKKWDGVKFIRVSSEFLPQSDIHRLEILPATKNAPIRNNPSTSASSTPASASASATPAGPNSGSNDFTNPNNDSNPSPSRASAMPVDPNDTTHILEQGFILLVSGRIVLGTPLSASSLSLENDHQESSLAFFDGQSWFPYMQSSRNSSKPDRASVIVGPTVPAQQPAMPAFGGGVLNLAAAVASYGSSSPITLANVRIRDQGVFRALAIAHLPRIISRDYLSLPYIILISIAISLGLIILIVLFGFLYVWLRRRLSNDEPVPRPKLGSSFMEEDMGYGHGYHTGSGSLGTATGALAGAGAMASQSSIFKKRANKGASGEREQGSSSALMSSLGIASAFESSRQVQSQPAHLGGSSSTSLLGLSRSASTGAMSGTLQRGESRKGPRRKNQKNGGASGESDNSPSGSASQVQIGSRPVVYRPNSTIAEATDALVTEFVKSHEQQRQSMVSSLGGVSGASSAGVSSLALVALLNQQEGRTSISSDMTNPNSSSAQGRFASLLAAATGGVGMMMSAGAARHGHNNLHHQKRPSTPSNVPASPITTMTTPGGNLYVSAAGASSPSPSSSAAAIHHTNSTMASTSSTAIPGNPNTVVNGGVIYYAKYPFRAREIGELGFKTGDRILVVDQSDDIWWMGVIQDATGQQLHGVFPSNYVGPTP
ncbi:hypothetical protein BG000_011433 [Podila horticola]|nr:hypothetical protein BG000_011433 [Podila horticola]